MLSENIREGIKFHFVGDFKTVFSILFESYQPAMLGANLPDWKSKKIEAVL